MVEAGLGGRYDATNVIPSRVQVLTGVGLEHTRWLGPTVRDIAEEKLAVVRDHGTLVVGELDAEARAVAERVAAERHARLVEAGDRRPGDGRAGRLPAAQLRRGRGGGRGLPRARARPRGAWPPPLRRPACPGGWSRWRRPRSP